MVKIQPRDLKLLHTIAMYGVLSTKQIQKLIFPDIRFTTMMRRLRLLEKDDFLNRGVTLTDQSFTWQLGYKGENKVGVQVPGSFSNRNTIDHDVLINDIRMKLKEYNLGILWRPQFELKSEAFRTQSYRSAKERLIPDGILFESKEGQAWSIAIEVELTRKSESRYKKIFREYHDHKNFNRIWYFVPSVRDAQLIFKMSDRALIFDTKRLWFSVLDSFLKSEEPQIFSVNAKKRLNLSDVGFDNYSRIIPAQSGALRVSTSQPENSQLKIEHNSAKSCTNTREEAALRAGPVAPDPSPSTMERGQELQARKENKECELVQEEKFKNCG